MFTVYNGTLKKQKWKYAEGDKRMKKYVKVVDGAPSANKKGLRIKVESVELDENNNLLALHIDYSGWRHRGISRVEVTQINKSNNFPEE